jgi:hypothetical protein
MRLDPVTEAISHFIGMFSQRAEEARLRQSYDEFKALQAAQAQAEQLLNKTPLIDAAYKLNDFEPGVIYASPPQPYIVLEPFSRVDGPWAQNSYAEQLPAGSLKGSQDFSRTAAPLVQGREQRIDPPGSTAVIVLQRTLLTDDDYVSMIDGAGSFGTYDPYKAARLDDLISKAGSLAPLSHPDLPEDETAIASVVTQWRDDADALAAGSPDNSPASSAVFSDGDMNGIHVNGLLAETVPSFKTYRPDEPAVQSGPKATELNGSGAWEAAGSLTFEAGDNTLVNSAVIVTSWTGAPVTAVIGDHLDLDIISQINVHSDVDTIGAQFNGWKADSSVPTMAFNIASVINERADDGEVKEDAAGGMSFPDFWVVTKITGNLISLNWAEQINFVTDNDVSTLAQSGAQTFIQTGSNIASNELSLLSLGQFYDLIIIGGNFYSANIISQTNILLDNDSVESLDGFETAGSGSLDTHSNLLWNHASIKTIGQTSFEKMSDAMLAAVKAFALGEGGLPSEFLQDPAFAGLAGLRVLYVEGSMFKVNYIDQTNILGDSDDVLAAMQTLDGQWSLSTGANTLVNFASIVDVSADTHTYVGGEQYSDALLYQADLIVPTASALSSNPDDLVSEAVVFLSDDMLSDAPYADAQIGTPDHTGAPPSDVMQSVLA